MNIQTIENKYEVAHVYFGINWGAASSCCSCADSLCSEMLFLIDTETAKTWLNNDVENHEIFTLPEAVEFAAGFFKPLMQQDSTTRVVNSGHYTNCNNSTNSCKE